MDTKVVLMDANAGPGTSRNGWEHLMGPHGVPYTRDPDTDPNCVAFGQYCYDHNLCIGHTWFAHKVRHKHTFYPREASIGKPRDMDHVLIDHRSRSCLEDVKVSTDAMISTMETFVDGELSGHRAVVAKLHCRLKAQTGNGV